MQRPRTKRHAIIGALAALLSPACLTEVSVLEGPDGGTPPGVGPLITTPTIVSAGHPGACLRTAQKVETTNIDKVDLLFMVDNSNSMAGEQAALKAQIPGFLNTLTTGKRSDTDLHPFPPVKDLHVGVVSSDMGIPGVNYGACLATGGDDGKLQNTPHGEGCDASYPRFLAYNGDVRNGGPLTDVVKFADDVSCIATLGTGGCGFEEQLEAPFKALMPSMRDDASGKDPYMFLSVTKQGTLGRGDVPEDMGGNLGFLRNDPAKGQSLIAIVVMTDEEDCSVENAEHLWPANILPQDSPYYDEDINLRCFKHKEFLYDLKQRYYDGFRSLRPGQEDLVVFAGIVGVPANTVDEASLSAVDFDNASARDQFYDNILNDPRMQEVEDPSTMPGTGSGNLKPSCVRSVEQDGQTVLSTAYPPRRIVELAKLFGKNGMVQSICQDDFGPAMNAITNVLARQLGGRCLPNALRRNSDGKVPCDVIWELPKVAIEGSGAPTECDDAPFLSSVAGTNAAGGKNCKVTQLTVEQTAGDYTPEGDGWFYDNFSNELNRTCQSTQPQRIAFSANAKPPTGVTVRLECQTSISAVPSKDKQTAAVKQPEIGSGCGPLPDQSAVTGDDACKVQRKDGTTDTAMFCHPNMLACVRGCHDDRECPTGWSCDSRPDTLGETGNRAYCVNPSCASLH